MIMKFDSIVDDLRSIHCLRLSYRTNNSWVITTVACVINYWKKGITIMYNVIILYILILY